MNDAKIQKALEARLKKLTKTWYAFIKTIVNGSCGCIATVKLVYKIPNFTDCAQDTGFQSFTNSFLTPHNVPQQPCQEDTVYETLELAVFMENDIRLEEYRKPGFAQIIVTKENRDKLMQADYIYLWADDTMMDARFERESEPRPLGWKDDYQFYSIIWKRC